MRTLLLCGRLGSISLFAALLSAQAWADVAEHKIACQPAQAEMAKEAVASASAAITKAIGTFQSPTPKDVERQQKWFGPLDSTTSESLRKVYASTSAATLLTLFWCPVKNDLDFKWNPGDFAAVHPSEPGAIFLTPKFFASATTGADSQMGTIIHELTHVVGVGLPKEIYGVTAAKQLAKSAPATARKNSDNFQYYVEDLVFGLN